MIMLNKNNKISCERYSGRIFGLIFCLGLQSGREMRGLTKDKSFDILTMLEISIEFPDDFEYVFKLIELKQKNEKAGYSETNTISETDFLIGVMEAKKVWKSDRKWERLLSCYPIL